MLSDACPLVPQLNVAMKVAMNAAMRLRRIAMPREQTGFVYKDPKTGYWYARITFQDNLGKRREIRRRVRN